MRHVLVACMWNKLVDIIVIKVLLNLYIFSFFIYSCGRDENIHLDNRFNLSSRTSHLLSNDCGDLCKVDFVLVDNLNARVRSFNSQWTIGKNIRVQLREDTNEIVIERQVKFHFNTITQLRIHYNYLNDARAALDRLRLGLSRKRYAVILVDRNKIERKPKQRKPKSPLTTHPISVSFSHVRIVYIQGNTYTVE